MTTSNSISVKAGWRNEVALRSNRFGHFLAAPEVETTLCKPRVVPLLALVAMLKIFESQGFS
jgi:hypothetical protein